MGRVSKTCKKKGCDSVFESYSSSNKVYCSDECRYTYNQVGLRVGDNRGNHGLTEIDESSLTAICKTCGPVRVRKRTNKGKYGTTHTWRCYSREKSLSLARTYGVTIEYVQDLIKLQHGVCRICPRDITINPYIDHNHLTGEVRGLLCIYCNTGIGLLGDSIETLQAAISYLKEVGEYGSEVH